MENPTISQAIRSKSLLSFYYKNESRIVEPHAHGEDRDGDLSLRAYQVSGRKGWRMFHVAKMQMLRTTGEHFQGPRRDYKRNDSDLSRIYAQL